MFGGGCAVLPPGVPTGQLGARALALIGVLGTRCHLTQFQILDRFAQLMCLDFGVGAISQAHGKVAAALAPVADVMASLPGAKALCSPHAAAWPAPGPIRSSVGPCCGGSSPTQISSPPATLASGSAQHRAQAQGLRPDLICLH
jgi:hypothetical protein